MSEERKRQALLQLRPPADEEEALIEAVFEEALAVGSSLSPQQKEILVLRVRCAMSVDDVCVALSISASTYHRSMRRAEEKLKELFAQVRSSGDLRRRPPFGGPT